MISYFILFLASCSTMECINEAPAIWVFDNPDDCVIVAQALNRSDDEIVAFCVMTEPEVEA